MWSFPLEQDQDLLRSDVLLTYTSLPSQDIPIWMMLYVAFNATDTDFMIKLSDIYNDTKGTARLIVDNAIRMRWRNQKYTNTNDSINRPDYLIPHQIYRITIPLGNASYLLPTNHSLRVSITSSNSPRFDSNRNNGVLLNASNSGNEVNVSAWNTVYHCAEYLSYLHIPMVSLADLPRMKDRPLVVHRRRRIHSLSLSLSLSLCVTIVSFFSVQSVAYSFLLFLHFSYYLFLHVPTYFFSSFSIITFLNIN